MSSSPTPARAWLDAAARSSSSDDEHSSGYGSPSEKLLRSPAMRDIEILPPPRIELNGQPSVEVEYTVSNARKFLFLATYLAFNMILTMYNKLVLGKFAFPWLLTALHSGSASVGCYALMSYGYFKPSRLTQRENLVMVAFSVLFTVNIAVSNISLAMVSVPFHQVMRSSCPVVSILIYRFYYRREYPMATWISLVPIVLGAGLATYGDLYFLPMGFFFTMAGVVLASVKTVVSNRLMTGSLALPALELLLRMSPLAFLQSLAYSLLSGEFGDFCDYVMDGHLTTGTYFALAGNGLLAFLLNVSSFQTNKLAGALTMTICGNIKQCLTVGLSVLVFAVKVSPINGLGMAVALGGAAWYSKLELDQKRRRTAATTAALVGDEESRGPVTDKKSAML